MILRLSRCAERLWGFTLIELLVVVAIIGILVAIMVPALTGAKDQAIVAKTLSRQRTIGAAYLLYMSDKGTVPLYPTTNANKSDGATMSEIQESLAPYLDLPETTNNVAKLYVNPVWWDGFAEINGYRRVDNGDGGLYYPNTAWTGGPLKYRPTGWDYNYYAHSTYTGTNTDGTPKLTPSEGFTRLNQIANLSKVFYSFQRVRYYASPVCVMQVKKSAFCSGRHKKEIRCHAFVMRFPDGAAVCAWAWRIRKIIVGVGQSLSRRCDTPMGMNAEVPKSSRPVAPEPLYRHAMQWVAPSEINSDAGCGA